ncbi:BatA domain-containing protein [Aureliella helgolandensis]|uniref:Aerotolerance regulator N-terminal domain-containing protein n=1 Tax=Aureliella helgolandensis TaxID=2527968 RepID=A0A518G0B3_9BACT|nr:BatA domain-containing protein [Aureliella helgolandensis]QDV22006.1 hypothetical protein Q31a_02850 [Aureliella helgolandensis]
MNFLNASLLAGVAAMTIPLVIHLLNRTSTQTVPWGAMHLLDAALETNTKRMRWESWPLLLVRCLIPILLALALARPVLTSFKSSGSNGPLAIFLVADTSPSMEVATPPEAPSSAGIAPAQLQVRRLQEVVTAFPEADIMLLPPLSQASKAPSLAMQPPSRLLRDIESLPNSWDRLNVFETLSNAIQIAQAHPAGNRKLLICSDFQHADWQDLTPLQINSLHSQLNTIEPPISIHLLPIPPRLSTRSNLAIEIEHHQSDPVFLASPIRLSPILRNFGPRALPSVAVQISIDGAAFERRLVEIDAGSEIQIDFACSFKAIGWHYVEFSVEDPEGLLCDNSAFEVVEVVEPAKVLLVDATRNRTPLPTAPNDPSLPSHYLTTALAPFTSSETSRNHFSVEVVHASQWIIDPSGKYQAIALLGASLADTHALAASPIADSPSSPTLPATQLERMQSARPRGDKEAGLAVAQTQWLSNYVANGGGLLVIPGVWESNPLQDSQPPAGLVNAPSERMLLSSELASSLGLNRSTTSIPDINLRHWLPIGPALLMGAEPTTRTWLSLSDGSPLVVSREWERGRILQFGFGVDDSWSDLPLRGIFVPLMQRLFAHAIARDQATSYFRCGDWRQLPIALRDGECLASPIASAFNPSSRKTIFPGVYRVQASSNSASNATRLFAAFTPPQESNLAPYGGQELRRLAEQLGGTIVESTQALQAEAEVERNGREIWRWCIAVLIALLLIELLLIQSTLGRQLMEQSQGQQASENRHSTSVRGTT